MSVFIHGNGVRVASWTNNSGVFIGQNVQNGWDSSTPVKQTSGFALGDFNTMPSFFSGYFNWSVIHQATYDDDIKDNFVQSNQR